MLSILQLVEQAHFDCAFKGPLQIVVTDESDLMLKELIHTVHLFNVQEYKLVTFTRTCTNITLLYIHIVLYIVIITLR